MLRQRRQYVQRRRIFVGCEGESERGYATLISNVLATVHAGVHIDAKLLRPGGGDPLALVEVAAATVRREENNREPYEKKYLLLDSDKLGIAPVRDGKATRLATRIGATVIWQETIHEALLLRHLNGCCTLRPADGATAERQLRAQWPQYAKPMSANQLALSSLSVVFSKVLQQKGFFRSPTAYAKRGSWAGICWRRH